MNEPNRTQWQIRCAFNGFCKRALKNEAMNAHRDTKQRQLREVTFSDLPPEEENRLYVCDEYFTDDEAEKSFVIGGKEITAKLLSEAPHRLFEEKTGNGPPVSYYQLPPPGTGPNLSLRAIPAKKKQMQIPFTR